MKNKIWITLLVIIGALYALGNATFVLNFPDINIQWLENKFSLVHFTAPGNNFVGSILRLPTTSENQTVKLLSSSKTCTKQVRGIYFNSQRGKRLRPLDQETLQLLYNQNTSYSNLQISWGLYTTCDSGSNYGIFGAITYTRWWHTSYLVAGTRLAYPNNKILPHMANSFQYFDNKVPIGYIYDSNGGIGFVGGDLTGDQSLINFLNSWGSIQSWFMYSWNTIISNNPDRSITALQSGNTAMETMRNIIIQWSVGLSKAMDEAERLSLLGNFQNKTVIYNGSDINSSTLINFAKQKTQQLCQGKEINPDILSTNETILCYENIWLTIDLTQPTTYQNKTIIIKSGNVNLLGGMQESSPSLDLFIDRWILYLPNTITSQTFNDQWFPSSSWAIAWLYLKWNFIINGLMIWTGNTWFNHKLHLQGKLTTLNTPLEPNAGRTGQIENMFGSAIYNNFINLQNVFVRTCGLGGTGSDMTSCSTGGIIATTPIVILNGNYPSNLLQ